MWRCAVTAVAVVAAVVAAAGLTQAEEDASSAGQDAADTAMVDVCTAPLYVNPTLKQVEPCVST